MPPSRNDDRGEERVARAAGRAAARPARPSRAGVSWTQAASRETRAASSLGLSRRTSASRSPTSRGRSDSKVESQRDDMGDNLSPRTSGGVDDSGQPGLRTAWSTAEPGALGAAGLALACLAHASPRPGPISGPASSASRRCVPWPSCGAKRSRPPRPPEAGPFRPVDLVELTSLDPTIRLDIRYATADNFLATPVYDEARGLPAAAGGRGARAGAPRPRATRATACSSTTPTGRGG